MKKHILAAIGVLFGGGLIGTTAFAQSVRKMSIPNSPAAIIWDISAKGMFDSTNKAYPITEGRVTVKISQKEPCCPTGLGHLASGRISVKEIAFQFDMKQAGDYWLHIAWQPGGSGQEQFEVYSNGKKAGQTDVIDAPKQPYQQIDDKFRVTLKQGANEIMLRQLSGDGLHFKNIVLCTSENLPAQPPALNPSLKYPTLESYEASIKEPGVMLDSPCVRLFAPRQRVQEAKIIFEHLKKAYDELYLIVGVHTEYKMVVYHFPPDHPDNKGGTSNSTIWYGYKNLNLDFDEEWKRYRVPHVSGYIEEMAHNFVHATKANFGWEMTGWSIGAKVSAKVADNPIQKKQVQDTRKVQSGTFQRYVALGYVFPGDIAANLCDRIHAHILFECEQKYGPNFWRDFFREVRKEQPKLKSAAALGDADKIRNERYRITVDCFDRLQGLDFKNFLKSSQISLAVDVKSLHPTEPGWNRKFIR